MSTSPLFDIYDPAGTLQDGYEVDPLTGRLRKKRATIEDLLPEEQKESMLGSLANMGSSGLSAFGYLLDTPGAIVRGLLAGKPLSGFGSSDDRVTGRELLRQYGMAGSRDTWGNFGGGLAAEVLLDPLTYLSLGATAALGSGAKTAAMKLAQRSGMRGLGVGDDLGLLARRAAETGALPNTGKATFLRNATPALAAQMAADEAASKAGLGMTDDLLREAAEGQARRESLDAARKAFDQVGGTDELWASPLARSNRLYLPGVADTAFDMYGARAGDWLAKTSDSIGSALNANKFTGPALRTASALFDPKVMGFTDDEGQWFARELYDRKLQSRRAFDQEANKFVVDAARDVGLERFRSPEFAEALGNAAEGQLSQVTDPDMLRLLASPSVSRLIAYTSDVIRDARINAKNLGIPLDRVTLPNGISYFPRQAVEIASPRVDPRWPAPQMRPLQGAAVAGVSDGGKAGRRDYARAFPRWVMDKMFKDGGLQQQLRTADNTQVRDILDNWFATNAADFEPIAAGRGPYDYMTEGLDALSDEGIKADIRQASAYTDLADSLRRAPLQMADQGIPRFGNPLNDFMTYGRRRAENESTADFLLDYMSRPGNALAQAADTVPGGTAVSAADALKTLGFNVEGDIPGGVKALAERMGIDPDELLTNRSFQKEFIDKLNTKIVRARTPAEVGSLIKAADWFTQNFKQLALLWPARYTRDAYSGAFAAATKGGFNPFDWYAGLQAKSGNYAPLLRRLESAPGYGIDDLFPTGAVPTDEMLREARLRKFLSESGGEGLTSATVTDDLGRDAGNLTYRETFPGAAGPALPGLLQKMKDRPIPWDLLTPRSQQGNRNWLLAAGDAAAESVDAGNRIGTYLTRIRTGDAPRAAKQLSDMTQVVYRPEAYTPFERDVLKRIFPFYSYTKGITPLIADELLNNPAGLTGQSIRAVNRAAEPTEDRFTPEYLRQSASIPLSGDDVISRLFGVNTPGITRFLTNIDLPHESVLNLFTPGVSNSVSGTIGDALSKTGSNILGQSNPLIKGPLEWILNRQFYSGRQLSDLYSVLEQSLGPLGRGLEQALVNVPGGSRAIGTYRQLTDQRISPQERAAKFLFNTLTGLKLQDVDQEKTVRLAARSTLNKLLDEAKGISTYENLFIKPEDLEKLSPQEKQQYLLYRVLQSEAARRARNQKKQDAMGVLGL